MAVRILKLSEGHLSLEFDPDDKPIVGTAIRELYGAPQQLSEYIMSATFRIGNVDFIYQEEWDDPCFISISREGDAILTAIAQRLIQTK